MRCPRWVQNFTTELRNKICKKQSKLFLYKPVLFILLWLKTDGVFLGESPKMKQFKENKIWSGSSFYRFTISKYPHINFAPYICNFSNFDIPESPYKLWRHHGGAGMVSPKFYNKSLLGGPLSIAMIFKKLPYKL